jgi:hypothetical protein
MGGRLDAIQEPSRGKVAMERMPVSWDPAAAPPPAPPRRGLVADLLLFLWDGKWWWILPTLAILALFVVTILVQGSTRHAPFIYAVS